MSGFQVARDEASAPFFDAAAQNTLLIRSCPSCGTFFPPQQRRCVDSDQLTWVPASGNGLLVSWAVDHSPALDPILASGDGSTSVIGWVELDEGPWMQVAIVDVDPSTLRAGTAMTVRFVRPGDGEPVPVFTAA